MTTRKASLLRSFLLALILAFGFGTAWFAVVLWLGVTIVQAKMDRSHLVRELLMVKGDGTPLIQSVPLNNISRISYRDLKGNVHEPVGGKGLISPVYLYGGPGGPPWVGVPTWSQRIKVFVNEREPATLWYFVHDGKPEGTAYFAGYERVSNRLLGYIGISGFRAQPVPREDRVPVRGEVLLGYPYWSSAPSSSLSPITALEKRPESWDLPPRLVHVPSGNTLRVVDLAAGTVTTVFEAPEPIVSIGVPLLWRHSFGQSTKQRPILIMTATTIYKLDLQYKLRGTFTMPPELDRQRMIRWHETNDGRAVVQCDMKREDGKASDRDVARPTLLWIAQDGAVQDSQKLSLKTGSSAPSERALVSLMAVGLPVPAGLLATGLSVAIANPDHGAMTTLVSLLRLSWPVLLAVLAFSIILAAIVWRRARAFGLSSRERIVWTGFVLLFGVPAFAGFWLHRRWPVRVPCPHCQARSPRDRAACAACGEPFPAPALRGNEIFA